MTITIPSSYSTTDINSQDGVLFGIPIQPTGLQTLAQNHNFVGASYRPPIGNYVYGVGQGTSATTGSTYHNAVVLTKPAQADGAGVVCRFEAKNDSSTAHTVRLKSGANTSSAVTITAGSGFGAYTVSLSATGTGLEAMALQVNSSTETADAQVKIRNAVFSWVGQTGSISDSPTAAGYIWANKNDHAITEPLTVEQYRRYMGGPRVAFEAFPQTASSFVSSAYTPDNSNKTTRTLMGYLPIVKRRNRLSVRFDALAQGQLLEILVPGANTGTSGTYYPITPGISTSFVVYETDPSNLPTASSATVDLTNHPSVVLCSVWLTSPNTTTQSRVFSVQAVVV